MTFDGGRPDALADLDRAVLWHPFTPMADWLNDPPLVIDRAEANELIDTEGRRYLDGVSSLWVNPHGHRHLHLDQAIRAQLDKVAHTTLLGLASPPSILLAKKLLSVAPPGLSRVFFSDSGSTAVEVALKISFQFQQLSGFTERVKFLALEGGYHGDTIGSVSVGGIDLFHQIFHPLLFHTLHVPPTIEAVERAIAAHARELCAVILEPLVQGAAGIRLMPPGLLRATAAACRAHGVLLIADEVATGFGRTGTMFACQQEGVTPDLLAVAKGLSGGYLPVAATLATEKIFSRFLGAPGERLTFFHGHSFGGNPLGCAAGLASLEIFERERTLENLVPKITALRARLETEIAPLPHVHEVRQKGFMVGIELRRDGTTPYPPQAAIGARVCRIVREHGVILRPLGPVVVLMPPLSITMPEIDRLVSATAAAIREATQPRVAAATAPAPVLAPAHSSPTPRTRTSSTSRTLRGLFVTGTDTGVGKTAVGCALLRLAHRRGLPWLPFKPVETGCQSDPEDARLLRAAAGREDVPLSEICPYSFPLPAAPALAAAQANVAVSLDSLSIAGHRLAARGDFLLVEAAGGLLSPYSLDATGADVAAALGLPLLLVAHNSLGTINHTALALSEIRRRALPLAGLIVVDTTPADTPDRHHNARLIEALTGVQPLGVLPYQPTPTSDHLADALSRILDVERLFARLHGG